MVTFVLKVRSWLRKGLVVKVVTKSLGDKYYKKKGWVKEVIDDFAALVVISETGAKVFVKVKNHPDVICFFR